MDKPRPRLRDSSGNAISAMRKALALSRSASPFMWLVMLVICVLAVFSNYRVSLSIGDGFDLRPAECTPSDRTGGWLGLGTQVHELTG